MIHVSTDYVFDGTKGDPYFEDDPVGPINVYGLSKEAGEREVRNRLEKHLIIRTSWVYGVHGHNFVKTMLHLGKENRTIKVVNDQYGCPTYAADLAEVIVSLAERITEKKTILWGTYHYCNAGMTTWHDFASRIFELAEQYITLKVTDLKPIPTSEYPTPAKRPVYSVLNCDRILSVFNIEQKPWSSSLEKMIDVLFRDD
jgi:dTDP-4-dehydrorhamnose reductase